MSEREDVAQQQVESGPLNSAAESIAETATTPLQPADSSTETETVSVIAQGESIADESAAGIDRAEAQSTTHARSYRFALLAASLVFAAAAGGLFGSLGILAVKGAPVPSPVIAKDSQSSQQIKTVLAQVKAELVTLKASINKANLPALNDTVTRLEKRMAAAPSQDITGSIPQASVAPKQPPKPSIVQGWVLRDVQRGHALVENRYGLYEIRPGAVLPGLGRVESITQRQDGRWAVVTPKGLIVSLR